MSLSLPREIAYDIFAATIRQNKNPDALLEAAYNKYDKKLKRLDRAFMKEIIWGSLRWYSKLYWILQNTSKRNLDKSSDEIVAALVMGTYQIYYLDKVPDRAAVNESVEYIRKKGQASACSFVNGILRQIASRAQYFPKPDKEKESVKYLALQFAHPEWMVRRWLPVYKFDKLASMLANNNLPPPITIRCNALRIPPDKSHEYQERILREEKVHSDRCALREALKLKSFPSLAAGSDFQKGDFTFQDEASQLIGRLVAPQSSEVVIDFCAGPGGKLSHIYELAGGNIDLIAVDSDDDRLTLAKQTMTRLGHVNGVRYFHANCMEFKPPQPVDRILLDAPCSGLGVLRRHPEGKWQKKEDLIKHLAPLQRQMLEHALRCVRPGGELVYSVCSFEPEESVEHLNFLTSTYGDKIEVVSPEERLPDSYRKFVIRGDRPMLHIFAGNSLDMDGFAAFIVKVIQHLGS